MRIFAFIMFALCFGAGPASAWNEYIYPDQGVANGADSTPGADLLHPAAARRRVLDLRLSDLPEALAALPENTWPYGRVIAVEEDPLAARPDRAQVRSNLEGTMQVLNDLGIVVDEWPQTPH